jgi:hypothetical protein
LDVEQIAQIRQERRFQRRHNVGWLARSWQYQQAEAFARVGVVASQIPQIGRGTNQNLVDLAPLEFFLDAAETLAIGRGSGRIRGHLAVIPSVSIGETSSRRF